MGVFEDYADYYDVFNAGKDYAGEARTASDLLKRFGGGVQSIINFGCGTGKHDIEFAKVHGFRCSGIDMSEQMIEIAKQNADRESVGINYDVADVRTFETNEKFDAVISLFHVASYQVSNEDIIGMFRSARKSLNEGGIFLFDCWYGPGVLSERPEVRVRERIRENHRYIRIARPTMYAQGNMVDVNYEILDIEIEAGLVKRLEETHRMRYFFYPEIMQYLSAAGFELIECLDCHGLGQTSFDSWTVYFVAKAV